MITRRREPGPHRSRRPHIGTTRSHTIPLATSIAVLAVSFIGALVLIDAGAYGNPSANPPNGNTVEPLNIGTLSQTKQGDLGASTFFDSDDTNYYINPTGLSQLKGIPDPTDPTRTIALDVNNSIIENVKDPQRDQDVATKAYVDGVAGLLNGQWLKNLNVGDLERMNLEDNEAQLPAWFHGDIYYDSQTGNQYITGGSSSSRVFFGFFNNHYFDLPDVPTNLWDSCSNNCWSHILGRVGNEIIVFIEPGGSNTTGGGLVAFDTVTNQWSSIHTDRFAGGGYGPAATLLDNTVFVVNRDGVIASYDAANKTKITSRQSGLTYGPSGLSYNQPAELALTIKRISGQIYLITQKYLTNGGPPGGNPTFLEFYALNASTLETTPYESIPYTRTRYWGQLIESFDEENMIGFGVGISNWACGACGSIIVHPFNFDTLSFEADIQLPAAAANIRPGFDYSVGYLFYVVARQTPNGPLIGVRRYK